MDSLDSASIQCPYCWQMLEIEVDSSAGSQKYTEDCHVCCRPILIRIHVGANNEISIDAEAENS